jgi:hypothetical protein
MVTVATGQLRPVIIVKWVHVATVPVCCSESHRFDEGQVQPFDLFRTDK